MTQGEEQQSEARSTPRRGHHVGLDYHRTLMDDPIRMSAYDRAIRALVKPGDVVLDVGCGAGILSMLAARRGAARVHGVEVASVAGLARQIAAHNGLSEQVIIHAEDIVTMAPVEPVDLVLGEFMGRFVVDDGMLEAAAAASRWLKPGGRVCPSRIRLMVTPVGEMQFWAVDRFKEPILGVDYRPALRYALNNCYRAQLTPTALFGEPQVYHDWRLPGEAGRFERTLEFPIERGGRLQALAGWFEATLTPEITLSTEPGTETHWGQYLFPLPELRVEYGDRLAVTLWLDDAAESEDDAIWRWSGEVRRGGLTLGSFELESEQRLGEREAAHPSERRPGEEGT